MLKTTSENYLLSPILDHKENHKIGEIEIKIVKNYENNLRSRNCQLGIVESLTEENPLKLKLGDIVFVNHFTFHGDIGDNKSFTFRPHIEYDGKKIFRAPARNILFKYNNNEIEPIDGVSILESLLSESKTKTGIYVDSKEYKDRGKVVYSTDKSLIGKEVLVEKNALYPIELGYLSYFKVANIDIIGEIVEEYINPIGARVVLQDMEESTDKLGLDLSLVKKANTVKAKILKVGKLPKGSDFIKEGDTVIRYRNYGIKFNDSVVVSILDDNINGVLL